MAKVDVKVPDIGDFTDVPVIEVLVKPGDVVKAEQSLISLESDKATIDMPSPVEGTVAEVLAKVGDKLSMGTLIARIESAEGGKDETAAAKSRGQPRKKPRPSLQKLPPRRHKIKVPVPAEGGPAPAEAETMNITIPDIGDFNDVPIIEFW